MNTINKKGQIMNQELLTTIISKLKEKASFTVEQEADCLAISNDEGLDAFLYVGDTQITVSSVLFPVSDVADTAKLNDEILRTHQFVPLSTISINVIEVVEYYVAFGALSVDSKTDVIVEEVDTLLSNVPELVEAYLPFLK
tara:strand:+ start:8386 stop:8808 length:423 start_codon:yes stop_codon:yes gene_type:complete